MCPWAVGNKFQCVFTGQILPLQKCQDTTLMNCNCLDHYPPQTCSQASACHLRWGHHQILTESWSSIIQRWNSFQWIAQDVPCHPCPLCKNRSVVVLTIVASWSQMSSSFSHWTPQAIWMRRILWRKERCAVFNFAFLFLFGAWSFWFPIEQPRDTSGGTELANFGFASICLALWTISFIRVCSGGQLPDDSLTLT